MPDILHRLTIDASPERVLDLAATTTGLERWWTGRAVPGDATLGGRFEVFFGEATMPAAAFTIEERTTDKVVWRCCDGPSDWIGTSITFSTRPRDDGGTTLLFAHRGFAEETEFVSGCATNWASYLNSLKSGVETGAFAPYPGGEVSRWD
jgi:uncharacterized protein YndB with AHSA1/START domain